MFEAKTAVSVPATEFELRKFCIELARYGKPDRAAADTVAEAEIYLRFMKGVVPS